MINTIKQSISTQLAALYPTHTIYKEELPTSLERPSFFIALTKQDYKKSIGNKYKSILSFDIAYYSDKAAADITADCLDKQIELFRAFDLLSTFRVINKQATITENVLHFTFDISYSEMIAETDLAMQKQTTNTNL